MSDLFKGFFRDKPGNTPRTTGGAYTIDERDKVQALKDFPQSSVGAPMPVIFASEQTLFVLFYLELRNPNWDGKSVKVVSLDTSDEPIAVVRFKHASTHYFGPPNDEAFGGHPLAARGLKSYGAFEVLSSSWIRALEQMNSVHPYHKPEHFADCRHFILTFHDTIFECIAGDYSVEQPPGSLRSILPELVASL
jgi:hypothetical protein